MSFWSSFSGQSSYKAPSLVLGQKKSNADQARSLGSRAQLGTLNAALRRTIAGRGQSAATQQLNIGAEKALSGAQAMAAGSSGPSAALAQRAAMFAGAHAVQAANARAAQVRAQEALTAQQTLARNLQSQRIADLQARGYSIQEAQALLRAQMAQSRQNMQVSLSNAANKQKATSQLVGAATSAAGGALGMAAL